MLTGIMESLIGSSLVALVLELWRLRQEQSGRRYRRAAASRPTPFSTEAAEVKRSIPGSGDIRVRGKMWVRLILSPIVAFISVTFSYGILVGLGFLGDSEDVVSEPLYLPWIMGVTVIVWFGVGRYGPLKRDGY